MKKLDLMRPKEAYETVLRQREADGNTFFLKYNKEFVDVDCPSCAGEGGETFQKYGFRHKTCKNCGTLFCSPRPTDDLLGTYYNTYESPRMWTELLLKADTERKALQYGPRVDKIVTAMKNHGKTMGGVALDLGAGSGAFSVCLKNAGFFYDVIATDLSGDCVKACRDIGLNAQTGTVSDVESNSVDLICMNDLIEHLFDPFSFLKECHWALRDGGFISIATPNGEGFDFKILKDKTVNITPPEHLTYFNPYSLELILAKCGFSVVLTETPGILDVEMVLKEKMSGYPLGENNEYIDFLLRLDEEVLQNFQRFLSENNLSSHMIVLARKKDKVE